MAKQLTEDEVELVNERINIAAKALADGEVLAALDMLASAGGWLADYAELEDVMRAFDELRDLPEMLAGKPGE